MIRCCLFLVNPVRDENRVWQLFQTPKTKTTEINMLRVGRDGTKSDVRRLFISAYFYQNLNLNLSKAALIRLMYSVANGAGSFEGWAESRHNDSHSFPLKGQLYQIEAL